MSRIAILGAGTAGLSSAIALSQRGHAVCVFEKHPTLAPVGAGLLIQPSGLRALNELGLRKEFDAVSVPVQSLMGRNHRGWPLVDLDYGTDIARGVSRPALTAVLQARARALGVDLRMADPVSHVEDQGRQPLVCAKSGQTPFDAVVLASGSGSTLAVQCGLAAPSTVYPWGALNAMFEVSGWAHGQSLEQRMRGPRQLMGLMPTAFRGGALVLSLFWSLRCDAYEQWRTAPLEPWKAQMRALWPESAPVVDQIHSHDQLSFATYRHAWPKRLASGSVCLVGDVAHAMSPQLGLGSTLAMEDALCLAQCLAGENIPHELLTYEHHRKGRVRRAQVLSRLLTPCFQADLPAWWRDALFAGGSFLPGVRPLMLKSLTG